MLKYILNFAHTHHFWCVRCNHSTTDVLEADRHEREHPEMRKIGTTLRAYS